MNSFNLFRLDEGNKNRVKYKYITPAEFQFVYDCVQGKFKDIVPENSKTELEKRIISYLEPNVELKYIDFKEFSDCDKATEQLKKSKKLKKSNLDNKSIQLNAEFYCSTLPKFMNKYISQIFTNLLSVQKRDETLFDEFVSLHIDIFTNFFINRERQISIDEPNFDSYRNLVKMYDDSFYLNKKTSLMSLEEGKEKNLIYNTYVDYQIKFNSEKLHKSTSYSHDCTEKKTPINKLLCGLTHRRETPEAFKFEKRFEHSNQFIPYKGNVNYQISTLADLNGALYIEAIGEANSENTVKNKVYLAYANTIKIILASKNVKEFYKNCYEQNNVYSNCISSNDDIKNKIELIFNNSAFLEIEEHNKMTKGDIMVDNPVSFCMEEKSEVLVKGDILELKYFTIDDITSSKKNNTLHITRILEPNIPKILNNIKESGLLNDYGSDAKFFKKFLEEIIEVIIEATKKIVEKDIEKIKRTFDNIKGLIIDGPKYIEKTNNWDIKIDSGQTGQQGRGVAIVLQLPPDFKTRDLRYIQSRNLFCFAN